MVMNGATAKKEPTHTGRYRLSEAALVTTSSQAGEFGVSAYVKNRRTGALYRFGAEELFLLNGLTGGLPPDALASLFQARMHLTVTVSVIEQFAEQMVEKGIIEHAGATTKGLVPTLEDTSVDADAAPGGTATCDMESDDFAVDAMAEDDEDALDVDEDPLDVDDENDLDALVFDGTETKVETAPPPDEGSAAGAAEAAEAAEAAGQGAPETGTGPANPEVSRRKPRFRDGTSKPQAPKDMDVILFDPDRLLRGLNIAFGPVARVLSALTLPLGLVAVLAIFHRLHDVVETLFTTHRTVSVAAILAISLFTVSLVSRLVVGAALQRGGAAVRRFGISFLFFLIPRFAVDMTELYKLDREGKMRVFAAALRTRLLFFALGTLLWAATRQSGSLVSDIAAIVGQLGLFSFLIAAFPLFSGEGYRLMSAYFDQPRLRQRSLAYIFGTGRADTGPASATERWAFALYGIGSLLTTAFVATLLVAYTSTALEGRFGGTGVAIFFGLLALIVAWYIVTRRRGKRLREHIVTDLVAKRKAQSGNRTNPVSQVRHPLVPVGERAPQPRTTLPGSLPAGGRQTYRPLPGIYGDYAPHVRRNRWIRRGILLALLAGAVYIAFLPYHYETGGDVVILADNRVKVVAQVPNEIAEVMVDEGDIVNKGDLLATQINIRETHALEVSKAELAKARASLQQLRDGATPEDIRVAEEQAERYRVALPFLKSEYERAMTLGARGTMSISQKERTISDYETGKADLRSAEASLERVRAQARDTEIAIAQADVDRLESEVAYNEIKLNATRMVAPVSGRVVFDGDEPVSGKYLDIGDLLMEIEDHTVARAEIKVPEADVGLIRVGEQVRLKAWAWPEEEHIGVVSAIAPVAETKEFGQVVRIRTSLPNENGLFRPGMTGYAKIEGAQMPSWQAFSRVFVRFFLIEVWGWIP